VAAVLLRSSVAAAVRLPSSAVAALLGCNVAAAEPLGSTEVEEGRAAVEAAAGARQVVAGTVVDKLQFVIVRSDRSC